MWMGIEPPPHGQWPLTLWREGGLPLAPSVLRVPPALRGTIFVEPLPAAFSSLLDVTPPSQAILGSVYKLERILLELLLASEAHTDNSHTAALRWVPIYVSALDPSGRPGRKGNKTAHNQRKSAALSAALQLLPHWRERPREHVVVVAMDRGRCFQRGFRSLWSADDQLGNATVILYEGGSGEIYGGKQPTSFPCVRHGIDIVVPPIVDVGAFSAIERPPALAAAARYGSSGEWPAHFFEVRWSGVQTWRSHVAVH